MMLSIDAAQSIPARKSTGMLRQQCEDCGMRLAKGTDYAYRILMMVAMNEDRSLTVETVATNLRLSRTHCMKIIANLSSHGFLETTRGRGGGLKLGKDAHAIRMGDVAKVTESDFGFVECLCPRCDNEPQPDCPMFGGCEMSRVMSRAVKSFIATLNENSLADVVAKSKNSGNLVLHDRSSD
ncbi:Rrf2 family transcriptional regulator [Cohaesibacter celericrescens]|uniref:Rrf2 family transcriptional regulator n=2 Tax=Cohaesibacter celericrescens TaxID=2067669 RepID=A0A2N5XKH4_9HYPH|nr:Rrf2 family transcriptional regulator [Cohaesibacter celericrescens]